LTRRRRIPGKTFHVRGDADMGDKGPGSKSKGKKQKGAKAGDKKK
jgi:hypothetical protein